MRRHSQLLQSQPSQPLSQPKGQQQPKRSSLPRPVLEQPPPKQPGSSTLDQPEPKQPPLSPAPPPPLTQRPLPLPSSRPLSPSIGLTWKLLRSSPRGKELIP